MLQFSLRRGRINIKKKICYMATCDAFQRSQRDLSERLPLPHSRPCSTHTHAHKRVCKEGGAEREDGEEDTQQVGQREKMKRNLLWHIFVLSKANTFIIFAVGHKISLSRPLLFDPQEKRAKRMELHLSGLKHSAVHTHNLTGKWRKIRAGGDRG